MGILVSGTPDFEQGKLLGVPVILDTTGHEQAHGTFDMAQQWGLADHVRALVFDITASNSWWKIGVYVQLERLLNKKLLLLAVVI